MSSMLLFRALGVLLARPAIASENGLLYVCDTTRLSSENLCYFVASSTNTVGTAPHNVDLSVGATDMRKIVNSQGQDLAVTPKPWTEGDVLVASSTALTGDLLNYVKAFEMIAPLRDAMMYNPSFVTTDATMWAKLTKPLADCQVKTADTTATHGTVTMTVYGTDGIYALMKNPNGVDIHHSVLQYLEEGAIDLVCQMTTSLTMDRCTTQRALGAASNCWEAGYNAIIADPTVYTAGTASTGNTTSTSSAGSTSTTSTSGDTSAMISSAGVASVAVITQAVLLLMS
ncbi:unnamed protein product [Symbiodinium natans]|uniref:Uncharacterized protein n=1 Tax=Symbiodinium natans TaxID=878477 RepID=A0A812HCW7_9DINO|nr:unnamed protein product [Symbiodinium natans]